MYTPYPQWYIYLRRTFVVLVGVSTFPVMVFTPNSTRSRLYSYLHRYWLKTSTKPVWLEESERGAQQLY
ncbi:YbfA family protein [Photobacterium sp. SDRW27]|uniref:DUF2517 family protein n=1 Tax=Photobacterium obscurum TaxID=2829490 RepID=UPI0022444152|nr:DUF2517 family protein [Photobacterium obscurum]MCW8327567.1 YbfA family protein [Photobacterium obscurum]